MKKVKRLIGIILAFSMVLSAVPVLASEDKVEIVFCVGDETLMINGTPVTVEKPYVVGEGVTLVPLRVITEAFGAEVLWEDETRTITMNYPDISIVLQIGNPIAEVNGKAETLLAAPELPTEYTMVPLRFISENFGAEVLYDEKTEKITVVKDNSGVHTALEGAIDSARIGDSYFKWSMENPIDMRMEEREFDGTYTVFSDENGCFYIGISGTPEKYDFEKMFVDSKASFANATLVKADKKTDNPAAKTMHFQAKDKNSFINIRLIVTPNYIYTLCGEFDINASESKDEGIRIMDTFNLTFDGKDIYDLSNAADGVRKFESEELKVSFNVPQDYVRTSSDNMQNSFSFSSINDDDNISSIDFGVYSKSETGDAQTLAQLDYNNNKKCLNETVSEFSDGVISSTYSGFDAFEYSFTLEYSGGKEYTRDVFFEKGDYTYNMSVHVKLPRDDADEFIDSILNSVSVDTLDVSEVGVLMRNDMEATGTFMADMGEITLELPNIYQSYYESISDYISPKSGILISLQTVSTDVGYSFSDVLNKMKDIEKESLRRGDSIVAAASKSLIGGLTFATYTMKSESDNSAVYIQQFATYANNMIYIITAAYPELAYSESNRQEVLDIIKTMKIK